VRISVRVWGVGVLEALEVEVAMTEGPVDGLGAVDSWWVLIGQSERQAYPRASAALAEVGPPKSQLKPCPYCSDETVKDCA
jgi:hypothetical protein